jgi:hypothetical protein
VLILSAHYFFTEIFNDKRPIVLLVGLILIISSIYAILRLAKRNIINTKHS